jgi:transposase
VLRDRGRRAPSLAGPSPARWMPGAPAPAAGRSDCGSPSRARQQREEVAAEVERLVLAHPLWPVLTSMPGVGVRTANRLLTEVAHEAFASAAHLVAYAGLAPVTRRSNSSIRGAHPSRRGNKVLKRALFLSAFAALRDPVSRAYYSRKIQQGKRHNQALIALARRRCDVLFAMLRDGATYQPKSAPNA